MRPVRNFPCTTAVLVEAFTLLQRPVTIVTQQGVQQGAIVHHAVQLPLLECLTKKMFVVINIWQAIPQIKTSLKLHQQMACNLPVFQVKQRDWWHGVQEAATHRGHVSSPHFWTVAGCFPLTMEAGSTCVPPSSGLVNPASSQRLASTDFVTLFSRTIHWTARTWNPLPPHVCEHFDHGVSNHSNFKVSAFPLKKCLWPCQL